MKSAPLEITLRSDQIPLRWILPDMRSRRGLTKPGKTPFNVTDRLTAICQDVVLRLPALAHIDFSRCLVTVTNAKTSSRYGLQARLTPLRLEQGSLETIRRGRRYRVQTYKVNGHDLLYLVTFCMPRFLDLPFDEKLITIVHELYHIGEKFDGDMRRHEGRCHIHTGSKKGYDAHMAELVDQYLATRPNLDMLNWLHKSYSELWTVHEGLFGAVLPKPRLILCHNDQRLNA